VVLPNLVIIVMRFWRKFRIGIVTRFIALVRIITTTILILVIKGSLRIIHPRFLSKSQS
jgi:hypothetical protein